MFHKLPSFYCLIAFLGLCLVKEPSFADSIIIAVLAGLFGFESYYRYKAEVTVKKTFTEAEIEAEKLSSEIDLEQKKLALLNVQNQQRMQAMKVNNLNQKGRVDEQRLRF